MENLKLYTAEFTWEPSGIEHITILAKNKEEAVSFAEKYSGVREEGKRKRSKYDMSFIITEKEIKEGVICSGSYCC